MSLHARIGRLEANMDWLEIDGALLRIQLIVKLDRLKREFAKVQPDHFVSRSVIDWGEQGPPADSPAVRIPSPPYRIPGSRPFKWPRFLDRDFDNA